MTKDKVWIIGLDGATWTLMKPWIEQGYLPNLAAFREQSSWGNLASTLQPITAAAWSSFMTGMNQGKHGLYDFVRRRQNSYSLEMTNASMIKATTLFEHVSRAEKRVATLNMPLTFPPRPVNGIMVSGLFANVVSPIICYPSDFYQHIRQVAPTYVINPDYKPQAPDALKVYYDDLQQNLDDHYKVADYMLGLEDWDLFSVVFTATDQVQHAFWHCLPGADVPPEYQAHLSRFNNAILDIYRHVDRLFGELLKRADENTTILVMSDHGAGPLHRWVQLNRWLEQEGFLEYVSNNQGKAARSRRSALVQQLARGYKRYVSPTLRERIRTALGNKFDSVRASMESQMFASSVQWSKSKAYCLGACGNIYLNVEGREPQGTVSMEEYESVRTQIIERLYTLIDPETNQQLVKCAHRREDVYRGPYTEQAPDIVIEWADYRYWGRGRFDISIPTVLEARHQHDFSELPVTGTHRPEGIFMLRGPGIRPNQQITGARIIDMAPTLLQLFGLAVPNGMDGSILSDALTDVTLHNPVAASDAAVETDEFLFSEEEESKIEQRLKDLGYL